MRRAGRALPVWQRPLKDDQEQEQVLHTISIVLTQHFCCFACFAQAARSLFGSGLFKMIKSKNERSKSEGSKVEVPKASGRAVEGPIRCVRVCYPSELPSI